jgi:thiosulfate/3-mercaptopyruvate sulfurtransferase
MTKYPLIIDDKTLLEHLKDDILIIDLCGAEQYAKLHIPGAVKLDYSDFVVSRGTTEGAMADDDQLVKVFSRIGLDREKPVVIYDHENNAMSCRLIWTLHVLGHDNVSMLNGGLVNWVMQGLPISKEIHESEASHYEIQHNEGAYANKNYIVEHLLNPRDVLVDTRSPEEYLGQHRDSKSKRGGHIPGSVNLDWKLAIDKDNYGKILDKDELIKLFKSKGIVPEKEIVVYCQSHMRSSHTYVVLKSLGFENVLGYEGSMSEWAAAQECPVKLSEDDPIEEDGNGSDEANRLLPLLVTPEQLHEKMSEANLLILDVSLPNIYKGGHISGAVRFDYPSILYQHDDCDCDVPSNEDLSLAFSAIGLKPKQHVVVYDRQGGPMATRLLWTLEEIGHTNISYLDGGIAAWTASGFELAEEESLAKPTNYRAKRTGNTLAEKDYIHSKLNAPNTMILDARMMEEFTNELVICDRGGNIPGAVHFNWEDSLDLENCSKLRSEKELVKEMFDRGVVPDKEIIVYCQTHLRSSHVYFVLKSLGFPKVLGYAAGYSEWGNDEETPIENEFIDED